MPRTALPRITPPTTMTNLHRITPSTPACYGVCCSQHARCSRYAAVEHSDGNTVTIASCSTGGDEFPLFIEQAQGQSSATELEAA